MIRDQPIFTGGSEEVWCWDQLEGWEVNLRRCVCFESSFACRVWQRERLGSAWMIALDGCLGQRSWPPAAGRSPAAAGSPWCRWPAAGYDEILIAVPAQQHTRWRHQKHCSPAGLRRPCGGQLGSKRREAVEHPYRLDLLRMRCPLGTIVAVRPIGPGGRMGVGYAHPRWLGWPASAREDKEVS